MASILDVAAVLDPPMALIEDLALFLEFNVL